MTLLFFIFIAILLLDNCNRFMKLSLKLSITDDTINSSEKSIFITIIIYLFFINFPVQSVIIFNNFFILINIFFFLKKRKRDI